MVILMVKVQPWESRKVQYERASWDAPRNPLYNLWVMRERVYVFSVGVQ